MPDEMVQALHADDAQALQALLDAGADPNAQQENGYQATALMLAASHSDPALVEILLAAGARVNDRDVMGDPAVNWASYYGHDRTVGVLLDAGADTSLVGHGTASQIVMRRGHYAALAEILTHYDRLPDRSGAEMALAAAAQAGDVADIERLAHRLDVARARDWAGRPVLQAAARADKPAAIDALIAAGMPVDAADEIGFTALFEAARDRSTAAALALIAAGADVNHVSEASALSLTPLHLAAIGGDVAIVEALLAAGAEPDVQGVTGATPILWASYEGQRDAVLALLDGGADASIATPDGTTLRAVAEMRQWTDIVERLDAMTDDAPGAIE